jgi:hypothetical protein
MTLSRRHALSFRLLCAGHLISPPSLVGERRTGTHALLEAIRIDPTMTSYSNMTTWVLPKAAILYCEDQYPATV